jgi:hypothetical protein
MPNAKPTKLNPDAPCSCGSKKRYRNCCKPKRDRERMLLFIGVVIGGVFVAKFLFAPEPARPPAPAGKVWSEEHGHYHDAPAPGARPNAGANPPASGATPGSTPLPPGNGGTPQPAGEAPPGKVWSAEHGHWHDVQKP